MLDQVSIVSLTHILTYLDPLSRWYLALSCKKMQQIYQREDVQRFMKSSNQYWFERNGVTWSGTYPPLPCKDMDKTQLVENCHQMLAQVKNVTYSGVKEFSDTPKFVNDKIRHIMYMHHFYLNVLYRVPNQCSAPIQVFIHTNSTNFLILYQTTIMLECSWNNDEHANMPHKDLRALKAFEYTNSDYEKFIDRIALSKPEPEGSGRGKYVVSNYLNNKLHGHPAVIEIHSGVICRELTYNNGIQHGLQYYGRGGYDYKYCGLIHGFEEHEYETREYFLGKLLSWREQCSPRHESITVYHQNGGIAKEYTQPISLKKILAPNDYQCMDYINFIGHPQN